MSSHADGHVEGQRTCDALLEAFSERVGDVSRKQTPSMCAFRRSSGANFAYLYHAKTNARLDVYFPSGPDDLFDPAGPVAPLRRKSVSSRWSALFAWHFYLERPEDSAAAARFLLTRPDKAAASGFPERVWVAEELPDSEQHSEGTASRILVNRYERDRGARNACLLLQGTRCAACDLDFGEVYGLDFAGLITVHHLVPLSQIKVLYTVNPAADLVPLCPNCDLVVHQRNPPFTAEELRAFLGLASDGAPEAG